MGNDGGSIPTRRELVKSAARNPTTTELKATQTESQQYHWSHDPLTRAVLQSPVVSDCQGRLYNKASILEFLLPAEGSGGEGLNKVEAEKVMQGSVRSLKDVVEVRFEVEAEARDGRAEKWRCPVTGTALGPGSKGVYLVPCGHAFSGAAIKAVSGGGGEGGNNKCLVCEEGYADGDVVPILPLKEEEIERLRFRVKALKEKGLAHSLKKVGKDRDKSSKKRKNREGNKEEEGVGAVPLLVSKEKKDIAASASAEARPTNGGAKTNGHGNALNGTNTPPTTAISDNNRININNSSTASLTAKVMAEQERNKKRRLENENLKSLFSNRDPSKPHGRSSDFMTRGFDIPAAAKR